MMMMMIGQFACESLRFGWLRSDLSLISRTSGPDCVISLMFRHLEMSFKKVSLTLAYCMYIRFVNLI